jgi:hypothetical protein
MKGSATRVPLYDRLPEIYRIRDAEQTPPDQLRAFLAAVEEAFGAVHENIEALYHDFFIETCDDWVVPYIGDLLGTSHLKGDARTLRADVADTIALRRRKGTLGALERLAANLTGWPCRCVELFQNVAWSQHLNHQRPDAGGEPPYGLPSLTRFAIRRGGTVPVRDPAMLSLLGTPFEPFSYVPDVKGADDGALHVNLPNLAIFLWRLEGYRLPVTVPLAREPIDLGPPDPGSSAARYAVRFDLDPLDRPVRLFNTYRRPPLDASSAVDSLTAPDAVPGPMLDARLTSRSEAGNPAAYISVDAYDGSTTPPTGLDLGDAGLQLYLRDVVELDDIEWTFRGDNLCAWEQGLRRPLDTHEIVVDPDIGRILIGVAVEAERDALVQTVEGVWRSRIFAGYTYGAPGRVGAHPVSRAETPTSFGGEPVELRQVNALAGATLQDAFANLHTATSPVVIEIDDSLVHVLDPTVVPGSLVEDGASTLRLTRSLVIRASSGQRPVVQLEAPLRFRPVAPGDPAVPGIVVHVEGIFLTRAAAMNAADPLIARAAVARLELDGCTLDPGGYRLRNGDRAALAPALDLRNGFGFADEADLDAFEPTPDVIVQRTIAGALRVDDRYRLIVEASIVDAGRDVGDPPDAFAVSSATDPEGQYGAALEVRGAHFFGRVRVAEAFGAGGLFVHRLEVWNHQRGCLKYSYFSGDGDRLPLHYACVFAHDAALAFTATWFGDPGYGQLARGSDARIRTRGPGDDAMGAYGFLLEAHKWTNLGIRLREFMPVGVRPLPIAVT